MINLYNNKYAQKQKEFSSFVMDRLGPYDPVFTFDRLIKEVNLEKYLDSENDSNLGRPAYNKIDMLKTILFAFMDTGFASLREIEDRCKSNLRYMYLMNCETPSYRTFGYFIRNELSNCVSNIFQDVNDYIFKKEGVNLKQVYIDGTKIEANANKYTWVWKKATEKFRYKLFKKITKLFEEMNKYFSDFQVSINTEYSPDCLADVIKKYKKTFKIDEGAFVQGRGYRKKPEQRFYEQLVSFWHKLAEYVTKINICGTNRNSYSKTDHDATFMRIKTDYMRNDQLLPAYNVQIAVADEYLTVARIFQYRNDMDCFVPLMEEFKERYGFYPKYPVADAGYGSYNNYIYCQEHDMEKYMKFSMYKKTVTDEKYRNDPFRPVNYKIDEEGNLICPNDKKMVFAYRKNVPGNLYGRQEEIYVCEDCSNCPYTDQCKKTDKNKTIHMNYELSSMHQEVIDNLSSVHGALLRMNRSIQAEGTFGIIKQDRDYRRFARRNLEFVQLELFLVSIGHNLYKYHNKQMRQGKVA